MSALTGTNAVVTGSTRGLGLSMAGALAAAGANVVINGRTEAACREAADHIGSTLGAIDYVVGSIAEEAVADALVARCVEVFGPLNFVVNNAGIVRDKSLMKMWVDDFDEVVSVHLRGTWLVSRAAARSMRHSGGSILNVTSGSALFGLVGQSNYAAAKGGVLALTRALSVELERYGVRVNALYPIALTDMTAPILAMPADAGRSMAANFGSPDDVARIVVALARPDLDLTSQVIAFNGTELSLWSHPEHVLCIEREAPWSAEDLNSALVDIERHPARLHPDAVGRATRQALGRPAAES